ncbi:MAG TPA: hemerythrin domain-containing protein [Kofleriaceae bacterium]|nr:hemerythrin domain-containing protein [Kofleriaceae bacterium]
MSAVVTKQDYLPSGALAELTDQHTSLNEMMDRCETLADALDAGTAEAAQVLREVSRLRAAFDAHNKFEERLLPALLETELRARAARIAEAHIAEHRSMRQQLGSPTTSELRSVIASLRAHLDAEQRSFETLLAE